MRTTRRSRDSRTEASLTAMLDAHTAPHTDKQKQAHEKLWLEGRSTRLRLPAGSTNWGGHLAAVPLLNLHRRAPPRFPYRDDWGGSWRWRRSRDAPSHWFVSNRTDARTNQRSGGDAKKKQKTSELVTFTAFMDTSTFQHLFPPRAWGQY